jgi:uncharacterized protein (DUF302 family)
MELSAFGQPRYGLTRQITGRSFDDIVAATRAALAAKGFGVLTEIDVQATLKKKIGVDTPKYLILGACNPGFAHKALEFERPLGLLLPCNVVVAEEPGAVAVSVIDPIRMFEVVEREDLAPIAVEVRGLLSSALEAI